MMSPTAGMLEGDRVHGEVAVEKDAKLILSNPTALRIHKMDRHEASWDQQIRIANGRFSNPIRNGQSPKLKADSDKRLAWSSVRAPDYFL